MYIRYKDHRRDNVPAHVREFGGIHRVVFLDAHDGIADVRDRVHIEMLLRDPGKRYELAYERYGVAFDASGRQIAPAETLSVEPPVVAPAVVPPPPVAPRRVPPPAKRTKRKS